MLVYIAHFTVGNGYQTISDITLKPLQPTRQLVVEHLIKSRDLLPNLHHDIVSRL